MRHSVRDTPGCCWAPTKTAGGNAYLAPLRQGTEKGFRLALSGSPRVQQKRCSEPLTQSVTTIRQRARESEHLLWSIDCGTKLLADSPYSDTIFYREAGPRQEKYRRDGNKSIIRQKLLPARSHSRRWGTRRAKKMSPALVGRLIQHVLSQAAVVAEPKPARETKPLAGGESVDDSGDEAGPARRKRRRRRRKTSSSSAAPAANDAPSE